MQDRRVNRGATSGGVRRGITYTKQGTCKRQADVRAEMAHSARLCPLLTNLVVSCGSYRPAGKGWDLRDRASTAVRTKGITT
jgi:hypothetical protein